MFGQNWLQLAHEESGACLRFGGTLLSRLLQGAAQRRIDKEVEGLNMARIAYAIEMGKAVELPAKSLDEAREAFEGAHTMNSSRNAQALKRAGRRIIHATQ